MKIIHIVSSLCNGGAENMLVDIANLQSKKGHQVAVVVINKRVDKNIKSRISENILLCLINRKPGKIAILSFIKLFFLFRGKFRKWDIIHSHSPYIGKHLKKIFSIPVVCTIHALNYQTEPLKCYKKIFSISKSVHDDILNRGNITSEIIYNGISISDIKQKTSWEFSKNFKIVQVGRLDHNLKGQDILLKAMRLLIDNKQPNTFSLDFIGDGASLNYLMELSKSLYLEQNVAFLGNKPREWIYEHLSDYELFVQPSRFEGFGLTVVEAMTAGVPIIVSENDGPSEITENGKYGLLVQKDNPVELAQKISDVIQQYSTRIVIENCKSAREHCSQLYSIDITAEKYLTAYKIIC